jgi:hypothetical protein
MAPTASYLHLSLGGGGAYNGNRCDLSATFCDNIMISLATDLEQQFYI